MEYRMISRECENCKATSLEESFEFYDCKVCGHRNYVLARALREEQMQQENQSRAHHFAQRGPEVCRVCNQVVDPNQQHTCRSDPFFSPELEDFGFPMFRSLGFSDIFNSHARMFNMPSLRANFMPFDNMFQRFNNRENSLFSMMMHHFDRSVGDFEDFFQAGMGFEDIVNHMSQSEGANPANPSTINHLRTVPASGDLLKQSCSVCMENFQRGAMVKQLPCEHYFHTECIDHWLRMKNSCPLCRKPIS